MIPTALLEQANNDGITIVMTKAGILKVRGDAITIKHWLPVIRKHKRALMAHMTIKESKGDYIKECAHRTLEALAQELQHPLDDLLDWYANDLEDIASLPLRALRLIVRDYVENYHLYRGKSRTSPLSDASCLSPPIHR